MKKFKSGKYLIVGAFGITKPHIMHFCSFRDLLNFIEREWVIEVLEEEILGRKPNQKEIIQYIKDDVYGCGDPIEVYYLGRNDKLIDFICVV